MKPIATEIILPPLSFFKKTYTEETENLVKKAAQKLLDGTYGSDFEKLQVNNHKLYSMRYDGTGRLILIKGVINGVITSLVVDYFPNHEYEELKRWTRPVLTKRIAGCFAAGIRYQLNAQGVLEEIGTSSSSAAPQSTPQMIEYGERYIALNQAQQDAVVDRGTPIELISGEAGSGKTLVLIERIARLAEVLSSDKSRSRDIWVIVPHLTLKRQYEQEWQSHSIYHEITAESKINSVNIMLPEEACRLQDASLLNKSVKGMDAFLEWMSPPEKWNVWKNLFSGNSILPEQLYQELCAINGLKSLDATKASEWYTNGSLQQVFLDNNDRPTVARILQELLTTYQAHLRESNAFDPNLHPYTAISDQHYVFMDETQIISPALMLAVDRGVISMNDSQNTHYKRRLNEVLLFFKHNKTKIAHIPLPTTHRTPQKPTEAAQNVQTLEGLLHNARKTAVTSSPMKSHNPTHGAVHVLRGAPLEIDHLRTLVREPRTAVVCLNEAAKVWMQTERIDPLLIYGADILGLEFENVVLLHPFDKTHKVLGQILGDPPTCPQSNAICWWEQYLHLIKSVITRPTQTLYVVQSPDHAALTLYEYIFKDVASPLIEETPATNVEQNVEETVQQKNEDFYEQACDLYRNGRHEDAFKLINHIKSDLDAFKRVMEPKFPPPAASRDTTLEIEQAALDDVITQMHQQSLAAMMNSLATKGLCPIAQLKPSGPCMPITTTLFDDMRERLSVNCINLDGATPNDKEYALKIAIHDERSGAWGVSLNRLWNLQGSASSKSDVSKGSSILLSEISQRLTTSLVFILTPPNLSPQKQRSDAKNALGILDIYSGTNLAFYNLDGDQIFGEISRLMPLNSDNRSTSPYILENKTTHCFPMKEVLAILVPEPWFDMARTHFTHFPKLELISVPLNEITLIRLPGELLELHGETISQPIQVKAPNYLDALKEWQRKKRLEKFSLHCVRLPTRYDFDVRPVESLMASTSVLQSMQAIHISPKHGRQGWVLVSRQYSSNLTCAIERASRHIHIPGLPGSQDEYLIGTGTARIIRLQAEFAQTRGDLKLKLVRNITREQLGALRAAGSEVIPHPHEPKAYYVAVPQNKLARAELIIKDFQTYLRMTKIAAITSSFWSRKKICDNYCAKIRVSKRARQLAEAKAALDISEQRLPRY